MTLLSTTLLFRQCGVGCNETIGYTCEWKGVIKLKDEGTAPPNDGHHGSYRTACYLCWAKSRYHKAWDMLDKNGVYWDMDKQNEF